MASSQDPIEWAIALAAAGTTKTSMNHPTQGNTQMFRRDLSESQYQAVLENPRAHTGQGYQTKNSPYYSGK